MNLLASGAMAVLGIQRLLAAQLIPDLAAMTASLIAGLEVLCLVINSIWCTMLPFVEFSLSGALVSIVTVGVVCCVGHSAVLYLLRNLTQAGDGSYTMGSSCGEQAMRGRSETLGSQSQCHIISR